MTNERSAFEFLQYASAHHYLRYSYDDSEMLAAGRAPSRALIERYMMTQPASYRAELASFSALNSGGEKVASEPRVWIFVPCFNEDENLARIVSMFDVQRREAGDIFELCFILNCPAGAAYHKRLLRSVEILLKAKRNRPYIHIVTKIFPPQEACLGRARKYGFDYCLQRILEQGKVCPDTACIICTEGDTQALPNDYVQRYASAFSAGSMMLLQGKVQYPTALLAHSEVLRLFTEVREAVYEGQGRAYRELPEFGGLMPCGRNFAMSPRLYAAIGGVDPIRRAGPEDDIIMGSDIRRLIGEHAKVWGGPCLETSPRREILLIRDLLSGISTNLKQVYECFHESTDIRELGDGQIEQFVYHSFPKYLSRDFIPALLSQLYQWVVSSCLKSFIVDDFQAQAINDCYRRHKIGYWEKENALWARGCQKLTELAPSQRVYRENVIADQALLWFQRFNKHQELTFCRSDRGLNSDLVALSLDYSSVVHG